MARTKGTYSLPANVEVLAGAPLDARDRVATKADLTTSGTFPYPYVGMETFVVSEGKKYRLIGENPTVLDNWEELGSGILEGAKTVTGNPITLADGSDSYAEDLSVTIEPVQDLHGYSYPWVGGTGKNKLHVTMDSSTIGTFSMVVNSDGSVTFNGTAPSDIQNILADEYPTSNITIPSGTYKLNGGVAGVTILVYADNALIYMGSATSDAEFTIPSGISSSYVSINIASGSIFSNVTMYPMVRLSTVTDGTFEPWENICPITGYTECEVEDVGKNLWDGTFSVTGAYINSTGEEVSHANWGISTWIKVTGGITVAFHYEGSIGNSPSIAWYDEGKNFISASSYSNKSTIIVNLPSNAGYVRFSANTADPWYNVQLEIGSSATTYESYHSSNATIQFGQTVYSGTVDFTTGIVTATWKCINCGDYEWTKVTTSTPARFYTSEVTDHVRVSYTVGPSGKLKCSHYKEAIPRDWNADLPNICFTNDSDNIYISDAAHSDKSITAFKTWLSDNNVQLCYELATPITIELTPTDLKLLKGTNNLTSNGTTISLKYWPDTVLGDVLAASEAYTDRNKGEGGGAGAVKGYYKTADGKFYEESIYTTEITPDASLLYLDLSTEKIYDCDGTNYTLVTTDEKVTAETKDPTDATWYGITFVNRTITNQKPYVNSGLSHYTKKGTTTDKGISMFQIGNDISTGTTGNKYGVLRLQSEKSGCADIKATAESTSIRTFTLPDKSGTVALTSDLSDTLPSAYCATPAGTAAKLASCSYFVLNSNSYIHVLIRNSNTSASALTLNINNTGAKPIYINGSASSSSNYTLPAGTYIAFYDGTNYYFRTDGVLPGSATDNTKVAKAGDTMTGALKIDPNIVQLMFRDQSEYYTTASYQTAGNEALVFATKAAVTSFMFVNNEDSVANHGTSRWQSLTPGLQIKNNCVSIGALIGNGITPASKLYVNGNSVSSGYIGIGGNSTNTTGARMVFDSTTNSVNFTFVS